MNTIGENIKRLRREKKLTQKQLGELCGINEANIRKYESGKQIPRLATIEKIAAGLEVDVVDLTDRYEIMKLARSLYLSLDAESGIKSMLKKRYGEVKTKEVVSATSGWAQTYTVVGKDKDLFYLEPDGVMKLTQELEQILPIFVDLIKYDSEEELVQKMLAKLDSKEIPEEP